MVTQFEEVSSAAPIGSGSKWFAVGSVVAAHILASAFAFTCFVTLPIVLFTALYVGMLVLAAGSEGGMGGPLTYPIGALFLAVAGLAVTASVSLLGLALDLARRKLRWPIWSSLAFAAAGIACLPVAAQLERPELAPRALFLAAVCLAAFTSHWIPLALSRPVLRLTRRWAPRLVAKLKLAVPNRAAG